MIKHSGKTGIDAMRKRRELATRTRSASSSLLLFALLAFSIFSSALIVIPGEIGPAKAAYPTISVGSQPLGIAFDFANGDLYVANDGTKSVSVISGQTNTVFYSPIPVGANPYGIAFDSVNGNLYVTSVNDNTVSVIATIIHPTSLTLNTISSSSSIPWGTTFKVTGKLTDHSTGSPISGATITFTGTGASNLANVVTASDGTFSATGRAPNNIANGWTVRALFSGGGGIFGSSNSNVQTYNTVKHATTLTLSVPLNVPFGTKATVTGKLTDSPAGNVGLASKTITLTTSNGSPLPSSATTRSDGTYTATFTASDTIFNGWNIQAHLLQYNKAFYFPHIHITYY
jgi:YVTN family beta-propeller protein